MRASSDAHTCANHSRRAGEPSCPRQPHPSQRERCRAAALLVFPKQPMPVLRGFRRITSPRRVLARYSLRHTKHSSFRQRIGCIRVTLYSSVKELHQRRVRSTVPPTPALQRIVARLPYSLATASAHSAAAFHGATPTVARPVHNSSWYTMAWGRSKRPKPDEARSSVV